MRLWPYQMLDVLPVRQLVSQWRECLAVAGTIKLTGTLNHSTVNRVMEYPIEHLGFYCNLVRIEFANRQFTIGVNTIEKLNNDINYANLEYNAEKIINLNGYDEYIINGKKLFENYHNERSIIQCLYGFQERIDCDAIYQEQWEVMQKKFKMLIDL